ncbi:MAG: hypothetical protein LQ351_001046 [Letrouitia transgressa]|nr:MAG: hypothetical protein LQ351_001046 [Letrouitia transgressa]
MPMIYKRFTEKAAEEWRQIYKGLQLLEFLIKNGSERVVDDARSHLSLLKMLRQFHFIDQNGKDQGINVRNRSKELTELLSDVEKIRGERKKARSNRNKFGGVEGGAMSGGISGGSRYGGFGSETAGYGGYSGGVYGDGGGFSGATSSFQDSSSRRDRFEEYDEYDEGAVTASGRRKPESISAAVKRETKEVEPPKPKEPEVDILGFDDDDLPPKTPPKDFAMNGKRALSSSIDDSFGGLQSGGADDDDFDDFQSATPNPPPTSNPIAPGLSLPPVSKPSATSNSQIAAPKPVSASQGANLNDLAGFAAISPATSTLSITSPPASAFSSPLPLTSPQQQQQQQQRQQPRPTGYQAAQPNYFTSIHTQQSPQPGSGQTGSKPSFSSATASSASSNKPGASKSSSNDAFGSLWSTASAGAGIRKAGTPGAGGPNLASMAKEKTSQGIWGAGAAQQPSSLGTGQLPQKSQVQTGVGKSGSALDDLLG